MPRRTPEQHHKPVVDVAVTGDTRIEPVPRQVLPLVAERDADLVELRVAEELWTQIVDGPDAERHVRGLKLSLRRVEARTEPRADPFVTLIADDLHRRVVQPTGKLVVITPARRHPAALLGEAYGERRVGEPLPDDVPPLHGVVVLDDSRPGAERERPVDERREEPLRVRSGDDRLRDRGVLLVGDEQTHRSTSVMPLRCASASAYMMGAKPWCSLR